LEHKTKPLELLLPNHQGSITEIQIKAHREGPKVKVRIQEIKTIPILGIRILQIQEATIPLTVPIATRSIQIAQLVTLL
jgi:hypothetical protein